MPREKCDQVRPDQRAPAGTPYRVFEVVYLNGDVTLYRFLGNFYPHRAIDGLWIIPGSNLNFGLDVPTRSARSMREVPTGAWDRP